MSSISNSPSKYVVFSYHKNHQELVLKIYHYLKNGNLSVWIDIEDKINNDIHKSVNDLVENVSAIVCFVTPMYQASKHCQREVQFAKSEGIPVISCFLLPNWKPSSWLSKITSGLLTVDLRAGMFKNNTNSKIIPQSTPEPTLIVDEALTDRTILSDNSKLYSLFESANLTCLKKKPIKYRMLPHNCRLSLSNLMMCNNEYILISANNRLHLFDSNLKLVRSNTDIKINENDLQDLSWCSSSNSFIILTKKQVYTMNPLTSKLSIVEHMKLKDGREEFLSCSRSEEKIFVITCQNNSCLFYLEEYNLPTFRFLRKFTINDFIGTSLFVQNGLFNKCDIQQVISIRYYQQKLAIIMKVSFQWFVYIFNLYDQPVFLTKIPLTEKSRMTLLSPINQWIIFKDSFSSSFIQMAMDFTNKYESDQQNSLCSFSTGFIDFDGKLRSVGLFGISHLVLLIDNALVLYKL